MTETRWLDERERKAWRGLLDMHAQLSARLHRQLQEEVGLSLADFEVLVHLTDQREPRMRIGELATTMQWEKSRLSHHVGRMQRRELVEREDCPNDARGAFIGLTAQGRAAIERAAPAHVTAVRELVFDQLTSEEVDALAAISGKVMRRLDNRD